MGNLGKNSPVYRVGQFPVTTNNNLAYFMFGKNAEDKVQREYSGFNGSRKYTYKLKNKPKLVKMNSVKSIKALVAEAQKKNLNNIVNAIQASFRLGKVGKVGNKKNIVLRNSAKNRDRTVAEYICRLGFDGYITNVMKSGKNNANNSKFHQELVLCNPYEKLDMVNSTTSEHPPSQKLIRQLKAGGRKAGGLKKTRALPSNNGNSPKRPRQNIGNVGSRTPSPTIGHGFMNPPKRNMGVRRGALFNT